jgi:hypothetical protein
MRHKVDIVIVVPDDTVYSGIGLTNTMRRYQGGWVLRQKLEQIFDANQNLQIEFRLIHV